MPGIRISPGAGRLLSSWLTTGNITTVTVARTRQELLAATEALLDSITTAVREGRLAGAEAIGLRVGKVINKFKMAKHFTVTITETSLSVTRRTGQITAEAALDGIYVIRTSVPTATLDVPATVSAYKDLARLERDFRSIKADDLDLRPIHHYLSDRDRAHVLICMRACYLHWHLRAALAPLTYTDEKPPTRDHPVAPAGRSASAARKASRHHDDTGAPLHSFRGLLEHLATLARHTITLGGATFNKITMPPPPSAAHFETARRPDTADPSSGQNTSSQLKSKTNPLAPLISGFSHRRRPPIRG